MVDNYEEEAKELIRKMHNQYSTMNTNVGEIIGRQNTEQGLLKESDVVIEGSTKGINPEILQPGPAPTPVPTPGSCQQCGMIHPPIVPGTNCPNAEIKVLSEKDNKEVNINKYLINIRDILISQISIKKIKDPNKLFKNITLEITKFLEGYVEEW